MRIAVSTPNGHVGHHLTGALVRARIHPLLLMRHPDRLDRELADYVDVVHADSRDKNQISAATPRRSQSPDLSPRVGLVTQPSHHIGD